MQIDFSNSDTLIFFAIIFILFLGFLIGCFFILKSIIKIIFSWLKKFFPEKDEDEDEEKNEKKLDIVEEDFKKIKMPKLDYFNYPKEKDEKESEKTQEEKYKEKEQKEISESLSKLKGESNEEKSSLSIGSTIKIPVPKRFSEEKLKEAGNTSAPVLPEQKTDEIKIANSPIQKSEDAEKKEAAAKEKEISESLSKLKGKEHLIEDLKSSLAKESPEAEEEIKKRLKTKKKITDSVFLRWIIEKIRRKKKIEKIAEDAVKDAVVLSSGLHTEKLTYDKDIIEAAKRTMAEKKFASGFGNAGKPKVTGAQKAQANGGNASGAIGGGIKEENFKMPGMGKKTMGVKAKNDDSIFGGQSEISRKKLEYKMRTDAKIWKAEKDAGLTLSPVERSKLVNQVFSQALGQNISKSDIKWGIKKLGQRLVDAKNPKEHERIRKEIKFFKKIGGIK